MRPPSSQEQEINLLELVKKVWDSRKLILRMCGIGAIVGLVIGFSTPKEYTASTLIAPESRRAYPGKSALVNMEDDNLSSSITGEKMPFSGFISGNHQFDAVSYTAFRHQGTRTER